MIVKGHRNLYFCISGVFLLFILKVVTFHFPNSNIWVNKFLKDTKGLKVLKSIFFLRVSKSCDEFLKINIYIYYSVIYVSDLRPVCNVYQQFKDGQLLSFSTVKELVQYNYWFNHINI